MWLCLDPPHMRREKRCPLYRVLAGAPLARNLAPAHISVFDFSVSPNPSGKLGYILLEY